jgi:hypothetical protein
VSRAAELRGHRRRATFGTRAISAVAVAATCIAVMVVLSRPASGTTYSSVDHTVGQAVAYAKSTGVSAAVVVLVEMTGNVFSAACYTCYYGSAAVLKLVVSTMLLVSGKMSNLWFMR